MKADYFVVAWMTVAAIIAAFVFVWVTSTQAGTALPPIPSVGTILGQISENCDLYQVDLPPLAGPRFIVVCHNPYGLAVTELSQ